MPVPSGSDKSMGAAAKAWIDGGGLFTLAQYHRSDRIVINIAGDRIGGDVQIEPDQTIVGKVRDPFLSTILVQETSHLTDMCDREVGLAAEANVVTPGGLVAGLCLRACLGAGQTMRYYYPDEVDPTSTYGLPDSYHHSGGVYSMLQVSNQVIFDIRPRLAQKYY